MQSFKKKYKKLYKQYTKILHQYQKQALSSPEYNVEYLVAYFKLIRDYYILMKSSTQDANEKLTIAALFSALSEYNKFKNCTVTDDLTKEDQQTLEKEKALHWTNFWQLVMLNIEDWKLDA